MTKHSIKIKSCRCSRYKRNNPSNEKADSAQDTNITLNPLNNMDNSERDTNITTHRKRMLAVRETLTKHSITRKSHRFAKYLRNNPSKENANSAQDTSVSPNASKVK